MSTFSKTLRTLRNEMGITQGELAKAVGVSKSSINMYERGEREPSIETLEKISKYFHVSVNILLGNEEAYEECKQFFETYDKGCRDLALKYGLIDKQDYNKFSSQEVKDKIFDVIHDDKSPDVLRLALSMELLLLTNDAQSYLLSSGDKPQLDENMRNELINSIQKLFTTDD